MPALECHLWLATQGNGARRKMHLPKTNLYTPNDSWDEEVKSWATTIRKVPVHASCSWTSSSPLKKHFMAVNNLCSIMWASSAAALHIAEPAVQQECHRQSETRIIVQPSVSLALLRVSQILLLSFPFLPNQHILQTLRNCLTPQHLGKHVFHILMSETQKSGQQILLLLLHWFQRYLPSFSIIFQRDMRFISSLPKVESLASFLEVKKKIK